MQKAPPQALQGVQAPLRFAVGLMHCRGACKLEGWAGGVAEQGQAKEIAEAAEELYRTLARSQFEYSKVCCTQNGSSR